MNHLGGPEVSGHEESRYRPLLWRTQSDEIFIHQVAALRGDVEEEAHGARDDFSPGVDRIFVNEWDESHKLVWVVSGLGEGSGCYRRSFLHCHLVS